MRAPQIASAVSMVLCLFAVRAEAQVSCTSPDPADWPAASKPYFLIIADTSGSMVTCTTPPSATATECNSAAVGYALNSCGMVPSRLNDLKCALRNTVSANSGRVSFGLETYASYLTACAAGACVSDCGAPTGNNCPSEIYGCTFNTFPGATTGCGNDPACSGVGPPSPNFPAGTWRNGGRIVVGLEGDSAPSNAAEILKYFDGQCGDSKELHAGGSGAPAGALRSAAEYLRAGWSLWTSTNYCAAGLSYSFTTPMTSTDLACRRLNVILITDDDETCQSQTEAVAAAQDLFQNGVTLGTNWPVRVHVIRFAGGTQANMDAIASAGGTTASYTVTNEVTLAAALNQIISGGPPGEKCDNVDNNCNGCVDEGYSHYADIGQTCCSWGTVAQRTTCLNNFKASINAANPKGNPSLLPCTTAAQQQNASTWLCYDPGDTCDNADNNGANGIDEGQVKCGTPLHCPSAEVCDGQDNDCDGAVDEGCPTVCKASPEVCDGCDNDCDGVVDDNVPSVPCGKSGPNEPPNCQGVMTCKPPTVVQPGQCSPGGGYNACSFSPQSESCDGLDNNCNGVVDDLTGAAPCLPPNAPAGLVFGGTSRCQRGLQTCNGSCQGFIGPVAETCNAIDDDCDGVVDDVQDAFGHDAGEACCPSGSRCGVGLCTQGAWACTGDHLECVGGVRPSAEACNAEDDDCNGVVDDLVGLGAECSVSGGPGRLRCAGDAGTVACEPAAYCVADAGTVVDAGTTTDAGTTIDAGTTADAGSADDAGTTVDAGSADDGGMTIDAGTVADAGATEEDAGVIETPDAGGTTEQPDAGDGETDKIAPGACGCGSSDAAPLLGGVLVALLALRRRKKLMLNPNLLVAVVISLTLVGCTRSAEDRAQPGSSLSALTDCVDAGCGDIAVDPNNCGACGRVCALQDAVARCADGECYVERCAPSFADIDGQAANGCEAACAGDGGVEVCDGIDNDCDGQADEGFDTSSDPAHCGSCSTNCSTGSTNAAFSCDAGACVFESCQPGFIASAATPTICNVPCIPDGPVEICDGKDNDCNGFTDDGPLVKPTVNEVCGVSPAATAAECTSGVNIACQNGAWKCTFPAAVCNPTCGSAAEICDQLDNNCNGLVNENVANYGIPCASDDSAPGTHGACRTTGTFVCNGPNAVVCNAVKANCATLDAGCAEQCDGVDNDCDGLVDETFQAKGLNTTSFVKPAVTKIASALWITSYEISRVSATSSSAGVGNGYSCTTCAAGIPAAPAGETLDRTTACSTPAKVPWFNVTPIEAEQTCSRLGGRLCTLADWQTACTVRPPNLTACQYGYASTTADCTSTYSATKYCNLGPSFDFDAGSPGDQDGLLPTASPLLQNCYANWTALFSNGTANGKIFDLTGNVRELAEDTSTTPSVYRAMGGSFSTAVEAGASCTMTSSTTDIAAQAPDLGFRCCFTQDPTL